MATTQKLSVSLATNEVAWLRARARRQKTSTSAVLNEAVRAYRELEARRAFLARLGPGERATEAEAKAIRREWSG